MAFLKTIFGKKNEDDDGQAEYFKEDFAPVVKQPSKKKAEKKSEPEKEERKKSSVTKKSSVAKTKSDKATKDGVKPETKTRSSESRRVVPQSVERIVNPKGYVAKRLVEKSAKVEPKVEAEPKKSPKKASVTTVKAEKPKNDGKVKKDNVKAAKTKTNAKATNSSKATKTEGASKNKKSDEPKKSAKANELNDNSPEVKGAVSVEESKSTANGKWDIRRAKDGRFFFCLYASNHTVIAYSQIYSSTTAVSTGINSVIANAPKSDIEDTTLKKSVSLPCPKWEIYLDKAGEYRFRLYAPNGLCVCHSSHGYSTKSGCKGGIESIKRFCTDAKVDKSYLK